jgi:6-phosphogluconolactonase
MSLPGKAAKARSARSGDSLKAEYAWHVRCKAQERSRQVFHRQMRVLRAALEHNGIAVHVRIVHAPVQQRKAIKLSRAFQLLAAAVTVATLSGCPSRQEFGGAPPTACSEFGVDLEGSLTGLIGAGLKLQNGAGSMTFSGPASNGTGMTLGGAHCNSPYDITVLAQPHTPSQTCVVANGSGTTEGLGSVTNVTVTCTTNPPRFAYVVNGGSNSVSAYTVDASSGTLLEISGSPFAVGHLPVAIAVDPTGVYAFIANKTDATISAFTIDRGSGALTPINGSPFAAGPSPTSVAIDPTTPTLYVTNGDAAGSLSVFSIAARGGVLTAVAGSPFPVGASPSSVFVHPSGTTVFVTSQSAATVTQYAAYFNGTVAFFSAPAATGAGPVSMALDASLQYLYVASTAANTLSGFTNLDSSAGLAAIGSSPYATGTAPSSVAIDLQNNYVYVANEGSADISAFALDRVSGELTALADSPYATGAQPSAIAIDPTDKFAYVTNAGAGNVSVYAIEATTGTLKPIGGAPVATGLLPSAIAISD